VAAHLRRTQKKTVTYSHKEIKLEGRKKMEKKKENEDFSM